MSALYFDTGVLLKLYTVEPESGRIIAWVRRRGAALPVTELHTTEMVSALRLKEFRKECTSSQAMAAIACMEDDLRAGVLRPVTLDWPSAWLRCQTLAQMEAGRCGTRTLDTLHVACAMTLHARVMVTSDQRQMALAKACGLEVVNPCA